MPAVFSIKLLLIYVIINVKEKVCAGVGEQLGYEVGFVFGQFEWRCVGS